MDFSQDQIVGQNIRKLRMLLGKEQQEVAVDARLDKATISRIESGICHPTDNSLKKIARVLRVHHLQLQNAHLELPFQLKGRGIQRQCAGTGRVDFTIDAGGLFRIVILPPMSLEQIQILRKEIPKVLKKLLPNKRTKSKNRTTKKHLKGQAK